MRKAIMAMSQPNKNHFKNRKSMKHSRFTRVLFTLALSLTFLLGAQAQTIDTVVTQCNCTDDIRVKDSIAFKSNSSADWYLVSYTGYTLPDSILWHDADLLNDEFYLSTDEPEKDTLIGEDIGGGQYQFSFVSFRDGTVAFDEVVFSNGSETLIVSLDVCTAADDGLTGSQMLTGVDTVCLNPMTSSLYEFTALDTNLIQSIEWSLSGVNLPTGSGSEIYTSKALPINWLTAGDFTVSVTGTTTSNCPIDSEIDVHVVNTDYDIAGILFGCAAGDSIRYSLPPEVLSIYDTVYWTLPVGGGTFLSDSNDVNFVDIDWVGPAGTYQVQVVAEQFDGVMCTVFDEVSVVIADTLGANVLGDTVLCLGETRTYYANVSNLDSIEWSSTSGTIVGGTMNDSLTVTFNTPGLDTIYITGRTMMDCIVTDSFYVDVKDSQMLLTGGVDAAVACLGDTRGYRAYYTDNSVAEFTTISWTVEPMLPSMSTSLDSVLAKDDSLTVTWTEPGDFQIFVEGMTDLGCMLIDTFDVSIQDTSFLIIGNNLVCAGDPAQFRVVQAADSSDVGMDSLEWKVVRDIGNGINVLEESLADMDMNDTLDHTFFTGTFTDATSYLVIVNGTSANGCTVSDTLVVESIGRRDLEITGPDMLCAGTRDTTFSVNLPDSVFSGTPMWDVRYASGVQLSPTFWTSNGDSLDVTFPNTADTFYVSLTATIAGSQCDPQIATKEVIVTDMINFVINGTMDSAYAETPAMDTICLPGDSVVFALNVDSMNVDYSFPFVFDLYDIEGDSSVTNPLPLTSSGSLLATYANFPHAGTFALRARGFTVDDCEISEELILTVKDTNYVITGDPQICLGDTMGYAFLQGWDMMPVDSFANADTSVVWSFTYNGGAPMALTGSGMEINSGMHSLVSAFSQFGTYGDSVSVKFDSVGVYELVANANTLCDCDVDAIFEVIVRGDEFQLLGPDTICNGSQGIYRIANLDSSMIDDLVSDSTMWTLASGQTAQISGATEADSIIINWNRQGLFDIVRDTLYFSGRTDDGCAVLDTLPIVINTDDHIILADTEVCQDADIAFTIVNEADSSAVVGLDSVWWVVSSDNYLDTIRQDGNPMLTQLDAAGMITDWPADGIYDVEVIAYTSTGCLINESTTVTVYPIEDVEIIGDLNTCYQEGRPQYPIEPDVYMLNIPNNIVTSITWTIEALGEIDGTTDPFPQPDHNGLNGNTLTITRWNHPGHLDRDRTDYRITATGTTIGGCAFSESVDIIIIPTSDAFTMICNNDLNITLPHSCELILTPDMILEDWESYDVPREQFEITVKDPETGLMISDQGIVDASMIGKRIQVEVEHECSGQICWGFVTLEDKNIPDLTCGQDTIGCSDSLDPRLLDFADRIDGFPIPDSLTGVTVNTIPGQANSYVVRNFEQCGDVILTYQDNIEKEICVGDFGTIVYRTWTLEHTWTSSYSDEPLSKTCVDTINIERLHIDTFLNMFAAELQDTTFECGDNVIDFANPQFDLDEYCFNIQWTSSEVTTLLCNDNPNTYTTTKTWTILDWCTGVVRTVSQTITVDDNTGPDVNLDDSDITTQATDHFCFGVIELDANDIRISDPDFCSDIAEVYVRVTEGEVTGEVIAEETYDGPFTELTISDPNVLAGLELITIYVIATDQCGNMGSDTTSRVVMVNDNIQPNAACDDEVTVNLNDEGWGLASWQAFDRGSNDNCGPVEICITRMDDLEIFDDLDTDNNNLVEYSAFQAALMAVNREGTNYSNRLRTIGGIDFLHVDSLCTNRLKFECDDAMQSFLGNDVMVQMTVTDMFGRTNTCMSAVEVRDNGIIDTVVVVIDDFQIDCDEDYSEFIEFDGDKTVRFLTNCGIPLVPEYSVDTSGLNGCGIGQILRNFRATDNDGNVFTHQQVITVGDPSQIINPNNIPGFWPQDFEGEGCPGGNIAEDFLPVQYLPAFDAADYPCSQADIQYEDLVFYNVEGYCAKVLRTWTLIDWCQMDDQGNGVWEYVQTFKLSDTTDPEIQYNEIETRSTTNANSCSAFVSLEVEADDCHDPEDLDWTYVIEQGATQVSAGIGSSFNLNLNVGGYEVTWTVSDPCGNADTVVQTLTVVDGVAPAMACTDLEINLTAEGQAQINAADFAGATTDGGCTDVADIEFHFESIGGASARIYTCEDLLGAVSREIPVTIVAVDEAGNFAECDVTLTLNGLGNVCGNEVATAFLAGEVATELDYTIDNVVLELKKANDVSMSSQVTKIEGTYNFEDIPMYDSYEISASREDDYLNGVTTLDLLLIQRHILGLRLLESEYKLIAADVDGSDHISGGDLVSLRRLILGTADDLPIGRSWTFVDASQTFDNAFEPFPYAQSLIIADLDEDLKQLDFVGVKMGDVNENVYLESAVLAGARSITALDHSIAYAEGVATVAIEAPVQQVAGLQASIEVAAGARILGLRSDAVAISDSDYAISEDGREIVISWTAPEGVTVADQSMIELIVSVPADMQDTEWMSVTETVDAELYTLAGDEIEATAIQLSQAEELPIAAAFEMMQNSPNPFIGSTEVSFYTPAAGDVQLSVFDLAGRQLHTETRYFETGWNKVTISSDYLEGAGVYIYEMNSGTEIVRKKMMAID